MNNVTMENDVLVKIAEALNKSELFGSLNDKSIEQVAARADLIQYEPDEIIVRENDPTDSFFILVSGEVAVLVHSQFSDKPVELRRMKPYGLIGEIGLLLYQPRTATIQAMETSMLLKFDSALFSSLFEEIPAFGRKISQDLAARVHQLSSGTTLPVYDRNKGLPDLEIIKMLPVDFIIRHRILPIGVDGNILDIGFVNDPTPGVIGTVRRLLPGMEFNLMQIDNEMFNEVIQAGAVPDEWDKNAEKPRKPLKPTRTSPGLDPLLKRMVAEGASTLHLSAGQVPYWRIDGEIRAIADSKKIEPEEVLKLLNPVMSERHRLAFSEHSDTDFIYVLPGVARFRVSLFREEAGISAVFTSIPSNIPSLEQLRLPAVLGEMCEYQSGLVLVTGPSGSGKSTTIAAMIDHINKNRNAHIVTLENPVKFVHTSDRSLINQREAGTSLKDYVRGLRAALKEDPDVIFVGELQDLETVSLAIDAADSGLLVFGTMYTRTAVGTLTRIIDSFPADQQNRIRASLCDTVRGVATQVLCRRIGGGRVAAVEILVVDAEVAGLLRENNTEQIVTAMKKGKAQGNTLLNEALEILVKQKQVDYQEAIAKATDKEDLARRFEDARPE